MTVSSVPALECAHTPFELIHYPGHGYEVYCCDCGIRGSQHPMTARAMQNFESAVSRARAAERRELKKAAK
jgi:hypothetical protein